jgi:hypothetical protein
MAVGGGQPNIPGPTLADAGKGRFGGSRRVAILERYDGSSWLPIGRYGSVRDADIALDEAVAAGAEPGRLRVVELARSTTGRVLALVGLVVLAVVVAFVLYVLLG